ncbi:MAG: hypothetical protein JWM47_2178 [Acidimicrobiales bacterium]|nr:hypothetical protein [Acidimicrobiales bacterium]
MSGPDDEDLLAALLDDEEIVRPRRTALRVTGAIVLIGLVALLVLVPGGWLVRRVSSSDGTSPAPTIETPTTQATLREGPSGRHLTAADWRLQVGASVLIGTTGPNCAGAVTSIGGHRYVTSARHCLTDVLEGGVVSPEPGLAQEVTGRIFDTIHVFDPGTHGRIATLDRIVVGTGDTDLLVATTRDETSTFRSKPARPVDAAPAVGDEVATFASSGAEGFRPQRLAGIYLGPYPFHDDSGHAYTVDLIGYRDPASRILVSKGHSGHSPTGAGGTAFGPLLFSVNRDTSASLRAEYLRDMGQATGLDLVAEGVISIDETLHLAPSDYARFTQVIRG